MKKIYLSLACMILSATYQAQEAKTVAQKIGSKYQATPLTSNKTKEVHAPSKALVLWENDFSNAGEWMMTNESIPDVDWEITTTWPENLSQFDFPQHASANNGYAFINSDIHGQAATQDAVIEFVDAINLSGYDMIDFQFSTYHRRWNTGSDQYYVELSNDNGATWTSIEVNTNTGVNTTSPNPAIVQLNVSNIVGDAEEVRVRFRYLGAWGWWWSVDDVRFTELEEFDLRLDGIAFGSTGNWGDRIPYYQIPLQQASSISFSGAVANVGFANQNDVVFSVDIPEASFSAASPTSSVMAGSTDSLHINSFFTPGAYNSYTVNGSVSSGATDATPGNNIINNAATINVNEHIYARDRGVITGGYVNRDDFGNALPFEAGPVFDIFGNQEVFGAEVAVAATSTIGSTVFAVLYDVSDGNFNFMDESEMIEVTADHLGQIIPFSFSLGSNTLFAGGTYMVCAGTFGGPDGGFVVGSSAGAIPQQSAYYKDETNQWFWLAAVPLVRLDFQDPLSTTELVASNLKINAYPNPAKEITHISFELENSSVVSLMVTDMSGKTVHTHSLQAVAGKNTISIPTDKLSNGVYLYNLSTDSVSTTRKLVVNK